MTKLILSISSVALFSMIGQCASVGITTTATCTENGATVSDPSACHLAGIGVAEATATASYSISGNTLTISSAEGTFSFGEAPSQSISQGSSSFLLDLFTTGPVRSGLVSVSGTVAVLGPGPEQGLDSVQFSLTTAGGGVNFGPCSNQYYSIPCEMEEAVPITGVVALGSSANLAASIQSFSESDGPIVPAVGGYTGFNETFSFFEADGVTPVDIALTPDLSTPEPSTWALLSLGSLVFLWTRYRGQAPTADNIGRSARAE